MSKYQEALNQLTSFNDDVVHMEMDYKIYLDVKDIEHLLSDLVGKETPVKMKWADKGYRNCGNCNQQLYLRLETNYCDTCGQKIDWGKEDE